LLLDRRCAIQYGAFSVLVAAQRPSFVFPATEASNTAPVIAHARLAGVNGARPTVGINARSTVGSRVLSDRSAIAIVNAGIAIVNASRITVHLQIARVV
jgi:hypothetical protein